MDFSEGCHTAVCLDFIYLFMSSANEETKLTKFSKLFKYYHQELSSALLSLHYQGPIPTLHQLHVQLAQKTFYGEDFFYIYWTLFKAKKLKFYILINSLIYYFICKIIIFCNGQFKNLAPFFSPDCSVPISGSRKN